MLAGGSEARSARLAVASADSYHVRSVRLKADPVNGRLKPDTTYYRYTKTAG